MAVYTRLTDADLRAIAALFGLEVQASAPIAHGSANTNVRLEAASGRYILTLIEDKTREEALELAQLLRHLNSHGVDTANPLPTLSGDLVGEFEGRAVMVKPYLGGAVDYAPGMQILRDVGEAMARLHAVPAPAFLSGRDVGAMWHATPDVSTCMDAEAENPVTPRLRAYEGAGLDALPHGLVHGDLFPDNLLVRDGRLAHLIDFEEAAYAPCVLDLGMALVGLCRTAGGIDPERARTLVGGYESGRALGASERAMLPLAAEYAALLTACWRFWKFRIDAPDPERRDHYREMTRLAGAIRRSGLTL